MAGLDPARRLGRLAGRLGRTARPDEVRRRATEFAAHLRSEYEAGRTGAPDDTADDEQVAEAVRSVDWAAVRAATVDRAGDAAAAARAMASEVDWRQLQPVATEVSTALIAAVAAGRLPLGGRLGAGVARAILDDGAASRVARHLGDRVPRFTDVIDTTGRESPQQRDDQN